MTDLGLPYPTILGIVRGGDWASTVIDRVVADGRYGVRLGQTPGATPKPSSAPASRPPARPTRSCATTRATVEIVGGRFGSARVPSDHRLAVGLAAVQPRP